ncbi:MAG: tripartite tricarboxylate transporter substrate binding protein [Rhizobiales bacterium]|nr:tripartite tricarboxylate transporter substrate binding protein [Hyphomicrobiales bacterium]
MSNITRAIGAAFAACLCVGLLGGTAGAYPDRPIRLLVSFPPGGSTDAIARLVQPGVEKLLGQPLVIENRPGAAGLIAIDAVAKAPPDGHVIGLGGTAALGSNHGFQAKASHEPRADLAPVTGLAGSPFILAASPSFQGKSLQDVIALAKAQREKLTIGHGGNGTLMHLTAELFNQMAGTKASLVPYRGMAPVVTDLIGSHVAFGIIDPPSGISAIEAGKIKPVAVTSTKRSPRLPDTPTFAESGLPRFESNGSFGIVAPAGTPADVIAELNGAFVRVLNDPEIVKRIRELGAEPLPMTPDAFAAFIKRETEKWLKVAAAASVQPN